MIYNLWNFPDKGGIYTPSHLALPWANVREMLLVLWAKAGHPGFSLFASARSCWSFQDSGSPPDSSDFSFFAATGGGVTASLCGFTES